MHITALTPYIDQAAALFARQYARLHAQVPALPERMCDPNVTAPMLARLDRRTPGLAALTPEGQLAGYLSWIILDGFRNTNRRAAYIPEWAWKIGDTERLRPTLTALYRAAAEIWHNQGVDTHAVSLLADDSAAREAWFWAGFGLTVVDAVRPMDQPLPGRALPAGSQVRMAYPADALLLAEIEAEHVLHYRQPPTLMNTSEPDDGVTFSTFLAEPPNSAWLAFLDGSLAGYLRVQSVIDGGAAILTSPSAVAITGLYVRPAYRGLGLAPALVEAARQHYAAQRSADGAPAFTCLAVDFESINPEAAAFWPRYFSPVTYSLIRVPEAGPQNQ